MADILETYSGFFLAESAGGTIADFLETYSGFFLADISNCPWTTRNIR